MQQPLETNSYSEDAILNILNWVKANPLVRAKFESELIKDNRRQGTVETVGTYYKEEYALQIIPFLDQMIADNKSIIFRFEHFKGQKPKTLWSRINQSFRYVIDHLDSNNKYFKLRQQTEIEIKLTAGIQITFVDQLKPQLNSLVASTDIIKPTAKLDVSNDWKLEIDEFIESAPLGTKQTWDVLLTEEQVIEWRERFEELERQNMLLSLVTRNFIRLLKPSVPSIES